MPLRRIFLGILFFTLLICPNIYADTGEESAANQGSAVCLPEDSDEHIIAQRISTRHHDNRLKKYKRFGFVLAVSGGTAFLASRYEYRFLQGTAWMATLLFSPQMIAQLFDRDVKNILDYFSASGNELGPEEELLKRVETVRLQFEREREAMLPKTRERVDLLFGSIEEVYWKIENSFFVGALTSKEGELNKIRSKLDRIEWILGFPYGVKEFVVDQTMVREINTALENVQPAVQKGIRDFTSQLKMASVSKKIHKPVVSFIGPPGTGKTTLARKYAKALGKELIEINLRGQSLEGIFGKQGHGDSDHPFLAGEVRELQASLFTKALSIKGQKRDRFVKNSIIFLDEFEKSINAEGAQGGPLTAAFLKLLDGNETSVYLADLDIEIDIRSSIFILASNEPLKNAPLASRIRYVVNFPAFSKGQKNLIARKYFSGLLAEHQQILEAEDETVIEQIAEADPNPGARVLEFVLQDYLAFKLGKISWDMDNVGMPVDGFDVSDAFAHHKQIEEATAKTTDVEGKKAANKD